MRVKDGQPKIQFQTFADMINFPVKPGTGGFCRKSDLPALKGMFARHHRELQEAIGADPTGRGFIYEMFRTELSNHEYAYTQDVSETLDCLGITQQMLEAVPQLQTGLALACRSLLKHA